MVGPPLAISLIDIVLPSTDFAAITQVVVVEALLGIAYWRAERREVRTIILGLAMVVLAGAGLRTLH